MYVSVVVPAYNEGKRLRESLPSMWRALHRRFEGFELIVVDDGSIDDTAMVVNRFASVHPEVKLIRYDDNRGKGYAVRQGILASRGDYVLFSDADQSTPMREIRKLMKALDNCDISIGSRSVRESRIVLYQPFYRVLMGKTFNKLVQLLAVPGIVDTQCGFKCFRGPVARAIFPLCRIDGFGFDVEVLFLAKKMGLKVNETGVIWKNSPESKVHVIRHSLQMLGDLLRIRVASLRGAYLVEQPKQGH